MSKKVVKPLALRDQSIVDEDGKPLTLENVVREAFLTENVSELSVDALKLRAKILSSIEAGESLSINNRDIVLQLVRRTFGAPVVYAVVEELYG
jgi:hypothetical protein